MYLSKQQRARMALRVAQDGPKRLEDLPPLVGVSLNTLLRWATAGKRGVTLDAVFDQDGNAWFSSAAAVERFRAAVAAIDQARLVSPAAT